MKRTFLIFLLIITSVLTSGCMKAVLRFNPDGSGQFEFGFNMSIQSLEEANSMSGEEPNEELDELTELLLSGEARVDVKTGISVTAVERLENGSIWTYMIIDVPTIEAWGQLEEAMKYLLPGEEDEDESSEPTDPSSIMAMPVVTVDGSTIRVELTIPSSVDPDAETEDDPFGTAALMSALIQVSYEIEMPGTLIEHNGQIDTLTGNPVWLIDLSSPDDLEIVIESTLE